MPSQAPKDGYPIARVCEIKMNTHYKLRFVTFTSHTLSDMMANMPLTDAGTQMMREIVCLGARRRTSRDTSGVYTVCAARMSSSIY